MSDSAESSNQGHGLLMFRCKDCGKASSSLGSLHAHIEAKHFGFGPWNIIPDPRRIGNFDADMEKTQVLEITDFRETTLDEVGYNA